jgi:hypothetical protein
MIETYEYEEAPRKKRGSPGRVWNIMSGMTLLATAILAGVFLLIYINPYVPFNPFPPPVIPALLQLPTPTKTLMLVLPPTWTPTMTQEPTPTATLRPTSTLAPSPTPSTLITPTPDLLATIAAGDTPVPSATPAGMPFVIKGDQATYLANIARPEKGCEWMGVAGRVFDLRGATVQGQQILLGGSLPGTSMPMITLTGLAQEYGPGYYEFTLTDKPLASTGKLWIQMVDQAGLAMSDKYYFNTYDDCQKNMILIDFQQVK